MSNEIKGLAQELQRLIDKIVSEEVERLSKDKAVLGNVLGLIQAEYINSAYDMENAKEAGLSVQTAINEGYHTAIKNLVRDIEASCGIDLSKGY